MWTSDIFHGGQPSCWEKDIEKLRSAISFILSRTYPEKYPEIKKALINFKNIANDFIKVFDKYADLVYYADEDKDWGYLRTRKFYKIDRWDEELYDKLYDKFVYHCLLVEDLALEMTRALNYLIELIRQNFDPKYRIENGLLLIEIGPFMDLSYHTIRLEYQDKEKENLYQGLRDFMSSRTDRSYYRGKDVSEDYFFNPF